MLEALLTLKPSVLDRTPRLQAWFAAFAQRKGIAAYRARSSRAEMFSLNTNGQSKILNWVTACCDHDTAWMRYECVNPLLAMKAISPARSEEREISENVEQEYALHIVRRHNLDDVRADDLETTGPLEIRFISRVEDQPIWGLQIQPMNLKIMKETMVPVRGGTLSSYAQAAKIPGDLSRRHAGIVCRWQGKVHTALSPKAERISWKMLL
jgi:hypothetical protein